MDWSKLGKHVFESYNPKKFDVLRDSSGKIVKDENGAAVTVPIAFVSLRELERQAMIQNIAVSIKHHGLRTCDFSDEALEDPDRPGIARSGAMAALGAEAMKLLEAEKLQVSYNNWPAPNSLFWVEYGERFGNYLVVITNWEGDARVHTLHISGEPVYWERYKSKREFWYVQNRGHGNGAKDRIQETKCDQAGFVKIMVRRCGDRIVKHLEKEIFNFHGYF